MGTILRDTGVRTIIRLRFEYRTDLMPLQPIKVNFADVAKYLSTYFVHDTPIQEVIESKVEIYLALRSNWDNT